MNTTVQSISFPVRTWGRNWIENYGVKPGYTTQNAVWTATRNRTGTRLPHWHQKIERGENATTGLSAVWDSIEYSRLPYSLVQYKRSDGAYPTYVYNRELEGDLCLVNNFASVQVADPNVDTTKCDNLAKAKFFAKLRQTRTQVQGMVFLGELRETLRMLRKPAAGLQKGMGEYLDAIKKRKKMDPRNWMRNIGETWLEHAFGWQPLINDIADAGRAYNQLVKESRRTLKISAGQSMAYDRTSTLPSLLRFGSTWRPVEDGLNVRVVASTLRQYQMVRYRGAIRAHVEAPTWTDNMALFGFDPRQILPTAWELLPWSFLADYFSNIGDVLDASITNTADVTYVNRTTIQTHMHYLRVMVDDKSHLAYPWDKLLRGCANQSWSLGKRRLVSRTPDTGISMPRLQFEFGLSNGQLGNIAALLTQALGIHPQSPRNWHR